MNNMQNINIQGIEVTPQIKPYHNPKRPDIKAYVSIVLSNLFVIRGFTIRVSKHYTGSSDMSPERYWVAKPISGAFRYFEMLYDSIWKEIEKAIIDEFLNDQIPIINEPEEPP